MPKLLLFAPCEKAIVEEGSNTVSLITVLQELNVSIPIGKNIDSNTLAPQRWYLVSLWRREDGDEEKRFEQRVTITDPGHRKRLEAFGEFDFPKAWHRVIVQIDGIPIATQGDFSITVAIRESGGDWRVAGEFPLTITHVESLDPQLR